MMYDACMMHMWCSKHLFQLKLQVYSGGVGGGGGSCD